MCKNLEQQQKLRESGGEYERSGTATPRRPSPVSKWLDLDTVAKVGETLGEKMILNFLSDCPGSVGENWDL